MQNIIVALSFVFAVVSAAAFSNGGFESTSCTQFQNFCEDYSGGYISPWSVISGSVDLTNNNYWQAADGSWSVDMSGLSAGTITQAFDTVAGNEYHVSFSLSGNPEGGNQVKNLYVGASGTPSQFYQYDIGTFREHPISNMNYAAESFTFTAGASSSSLTFQSAEFTAWGPVVDAISVSSFTPAQVCSQFTFNNPGYFCGTNTGGFYTCMNGAWSALSSWQSCPSGTSCWCAYGVECSNGGTESPCRDSTSNRRK